MRRPLRIGIDARPLHWPGIGRFISQLLEHLGQVDQDNQYLVYLQVDDARRATFDLGSNFQSVPERSSVNSISEQIALARRIRADRLDVFHAPTSLVVPAFCRIPLVVTVHDILLKLRPDFLDARLARFYVAVMNRVALQKAHTLVAVSDFTGSEIARIYPAFKSKIRIIHNGVSPMFYPRAVSTGVRERLRKIGIRGRFVLYVGTLKRQKNVPALVTGFAMLREDLRQKLQLVLVTRPDARYPEVPGLVEKHGLRDSTVFASGLSDEALADVYRAADVLVMPSTYEGFGLPVIEAMACGTAVAVSDIPVFHEVAGDAASYFNPSDPRSITKILERLLNDTRYRDEHARLGCSRAARFSWRCVAQNMRSVYEQAAWRVPNPHP